MHDELAFLNDKVWVGVPLEVAQQDPAAKSIGTRWVVSTWAGDTKSHQRSTLPRISTTKKDTPCDEIRQAFGSLTQLMSYRIVP